MLLAIALTGVESFGARLSAQQIEVDANAGQPIVVPAGQGRILRFDQPAESVFVADTQIADVRVVSPGVVYLYATKIGRTNLIALSPDQSMRGSMQIQVTADPRPANEAARAVQPTTAMTIKMFGAKPVATGPVRNVGEAMDAAAVAESFAPQGSPPINNTVIQGTQQVNIRVRFAEVSRNDLLAYGVSWDAMANPGSFSFGLMNGSGAGGGRGLTNGSYRVGLGLHTKNVNIDVLLEALQRNGVLTVLAEPNITAITGQTASFLAGGEIPVPVPVANDQIGIQYKQFGVSLLFTPTLLPNRRIALQVRPEVSSLSNAGAITLRNIQVPALQVRRADTTVEVASGQTFAIAGLFQRNMTQDLDRFPVLGDVPVLGELFKSTRYQKNETELVILITPYLVKPVSEKSLKTPLDSPTGAAAVPRRPSGKKPAQNGAYGFVVD
ncbi:type II and III secretion system protein family protein [Chenggangzhangella methanolivorans]|nr:type II and III secretion system protein family protein [Chenggangzhangella methanolivorans]